MKKALMVVVLLLGASANCAPSRAQQPAQAKVVGKWQMVWAGTSSPAAFNADGSYWCDWVDGRRWAGTWSMAGDELVVEESPVAAAAAAVTWTARLQVGSLKGDLDRGGEFELKP